MIRGCLDESTVLHFFRGELSAPEQTSVDEHIDECSACRTLISSLAKADMGSSDRIDLLDTVAAPPPASEDRGPPSSLAPGVVLANRFEVQKLVGVGGMGQVFSGRDRETGDKVAIKLTLGQSGEETRRFEREARLLLALRHPAIVRHVADGRSKEGTPYLVMEWLDGEDLASRLTRGPLGVAATVTLGIRIAAALAASHAIGVVHRDIKPSNIFLRGGLVEEATLLDFGVARPNRPEVTADATRTGALLGTLGYMAPEQALGAKTADRRADIFSLGCVLYECLVGKRLFAGAHAVEVLANLLTQPVRHPRELASNVPDALDGLVVKMVARNAATRPADCTAVVAALERVVLESSESARASKWLRGLGFAAAGLVLVPAVTLMTAHLRSQRPTAAPASEMPTATPTAPQPDASADSPATLPTPSPSAATAVPSGSATAPSATTLPGAPTARPAPPMKPHTSDPFGTFRN